MEGVCTMLEEFEYFLRGLNLSENTVKSYLYALKQYESLYGTVSRKAVRDYKVFLQENYKPQTVNLRIRAINCYLESGRFPVSRCNKRPFWKMLSARRTIHI